MSEVQSPKSRVLVTGANGFVGSHLVEALLKKGSQVRCLVRPTSDLKWLKGLDLEYIYGSVEEKPSLIPAVRGVDYVFHLAAVVRAVRPQTYFQVNVQGTQNLLQAVADANPTLKKFVYISSQAASGPGQSTLPKKTQDPCLPLTDYGKTKLQGEEIVKRFGQHFPWVILRPSAVYGPRDKDIYAYFRLVKKGIIPLIGKGEKYINLCYVGDLVSAIILATESVAGQGKIYFVAEDRVYSWQEIGGLISRALGKKGLKLHIPEKLVLKLGLFFELLSQVTCRPALLSKDKSQEMVQQCWTCDLTSTRQDLGFVARTPLEEGVKITARWYLDHGWL